MRHFAVVLALAVAASTQAMASEPPHKRHVRMPRQAEVDTAPGCPGYHHRGVSGACVLNPDYGPYRPIPKAVASSNGPRRIAHCGQVQGRAWTERQ